MCFVELLTIGVVDMFIVERDNANRTISMSLTRRQNQRLSENTRGVCVRLAEELFKINSYIGMMPGLNLMELESSVHLLNFQDFAERLRAISSSITAGLISELAQLQGRIFFETVRLAKIICQIKLDIVNQVDLYCAAKGKIFLLLSEIERFNEMPRVDTEAFADLIRCYETQIRIVDASFDQVNGLWGELAALQADYLRLFANAINCIMSASTPVIEAMRCELEARDYAPDFEAVKSSWMKELNSRMAKNTDTLLDSLVKKVMAVSPIVADGDAHGCGRAPHDVHAPTAVLSRVLLQ